MNQYIINFKNDVSESDINHYFTQNNLTIVKSYNKFEKIYCVSGNTIPPNSDLIEDIVEDSIGQVVPLDTVNIGLPQLQTPIDIADNKNWWKVASFFNVDYEQSIHLHGKIGERVNVYILDSGIDINHPEFENTDIELLYSFTNDFADKSGHGTAIASVISGKTCGLTNAKLKILKIFDQGQSISLNQLLDALNTIINHQTDSIFNVVNMSWSIAKNDFIEKVIRSMISNKLHVVCAAGNSGISIKDVTPASMLEVITIGAYNQDFKPCDFSNFTDPNAIDNTPDQVNYGIIDGWAPGENIWAATPNGGYAYVSGTSIACAIHASAIAYDADHTGIKHNGLWEGWLIKHPGTMTIGYVLSRPGILSLNDKYSSSANVITTFPGTNSVYFGRNRYYLNKNVALTAGDLAYSIPIIDKLMVKTVEFDRPLLEHLHINEEGIMYYDSELPDGTNYLMDSYKVKVTFKDDYVVEDRIVVGITRNIKDWDAETIPKEYEWITLNLLFGCCTICGAGGGASCGRCCSCSNAYACGTFKWDEACEVCSSNS